MALGDPYLTLNESKGHLGIPTSDVVDDVLLERARMSVSRWIDSYCGRQFNVASSATARVFRVDAPYLAVVDDISTTTGLIVKTDPGDDGTFDTTWTTSDYELEPLNGVVDGVTGWPYWRIRAVNALTFPCGYRALLQVTATWGWPAVPDAVKQACAIQMSRVFKRKDSPEGVLGGFDSFGPVRVGTRLDPDVQAILDPYRRMGGLVVA